MQQQVSVFVDLESSDSPEEKQPEEERLLVPEPTVEEESEEAVAEAEAIIEAAQAPDAVPGAETETEETIVEVPQAEVVGVIGDTEASTAEALDEDAVLAALILEEESAENMLPETAENTASLSVDELESFTIDDVVEEDEEGYEDEEGELDGELVAETSVLTPDAGKIRFAEDIVGDHRGGSGRRARGARRGGAGAARGGVRRGPGPRPGPARGPGPTPGPGR